MVPLVWVLESQRVAGADEMAVLVVEDDDVHWVEIAVVDVVDVVAVVAVVAGPKEGPKRGLWMVRLALLL